MADAQGNFALNGFDPGQHEFVTANVFDLLADYAGRGRTFDIVVSERMEDLRNRLVIG